MEPTAVGILIENRFGFTVHAEVNRRENTRQRQNNICRVHMQEKEVAIKYGKK